MSEEQVTSAEEYIDKGLEGVRAVQDTMETFLEAASVDAVYGEPVLHGDTVIIPAAEVLSGLGFGVGFGGGTGEDEEENESGSGYGGGGGGGGRILSRPVAIIVAGPEGVRVEPVVDPTKIALAALTAGGFMISMLARMAGKKN